jgi:hypothetical protein
VFIDVRFSPRDVGPNGELVSYSSCRSLFEMSMSYSGPLGQSYSGYIHLCMKTHQPWDRLKLPLNRDGNMQESRWHITARISV